MSNRIVIIALFAGLLVTGLICVNEHLTVNRWEMLYTDLEKRYTELKDKSVQENKMVISVGHGEFREPSLARQNRNLLNIKTPLKKGEYWKGQIGVDKFKHAIFSDPVWSIRAGIVLLKNYETKHKVDTITKLVNRFCTGNQKEYIKFLCKATKFGPDQKISLTKNLHLIIPAMIVFETGEIIGMEYVEIIKATME